MADFQARHYQALARLMQEAKRDDFTDQQGGLDMLQRKLTDMLARDNPKFKRDLFEAACEPGADVNARTPEGTRQ